MSLSNIKSANDPLDNSRATWKTLLQFHLLDVRSNHINLRGSDVSFSVILDEQAPNQ